MFQSPSLRGSGRFLKYCGRSGRTLEFQSPSLRGSGRFKRRTRLAPKPRRKFQSPSLRGSGRFSVFVGGAPHHDASRFNPLHCGAVVASGLSPEENQQEVKFQSPSLRGSGRFAKAEAKARREAERFNPLHCGAVVASECPSPHGGWARRTFQSPSLRGSGRFPQRLERQLEALAPNPLHCGAVVASPSSGIAYAVYLDDQSPSLRGSGRFPARREAADRERAQPIPFIAGQWSLPPPRTTPSSLFGVLLRKRRLPCDHIICTRLPF